MILDDYIPLSEWCKRESISYPNAANHFRRGKIPGYTEKHGGVKRHYVKSDFKKNHIFDIDAGPDYIPLMQWAKREGINKNTAAGWHNRNLLKTKKIGKFVFVHKDFTKEIFEREKEERIANSRKKTHQIKIWNRYKKHQRTELGRNIFEESKKIYKKNGGRLTNIINNLCEKYSSENEEISLFEVFMLDGQEIKMA